MIDLVIQAGRRDLGGFEVGRVLPAAERRMVGPFVFFDHIGPVVLPPNVPRSFDVRPHPHIGLATVTYLFAGEITHRDSIGYAQVIQPGEVNWMTAGRGISHSERFDTMRRSGGLLHGIQAWVALPEEQEEIAPSFVHIGSNDLPSRELAGAYVKIIAGSAFGLTSRVATLSSLFYVHVGLQAHAACDVPPGYPERAVYVAEGRIRIAAREYHPGQMIVLEAGSSVTLVALDPAIVMLLGGEPLGTRHLWWNFVSSRKERIEQAKAEWKAGRIPLPASDAAEFIPLPEEPPPPPEPMS